MVTRKTRKKSGWRTPNVTRQSMKWSEVLEKCLEPLPTYNDWLDYRDGIRDWPGKKRKEREIEKGKRKNEKKI